MAKHHVQVQPFITQCVVPLPAGDSGLGVTAEYSQSTQGLQVQEAVGVDSHILQAKEHDAKSILNTVISTANLPYKPVRDADRKRYVVDYHQKECVHNECQDAARTELPIQCTDKCHRGELISPG